MALSRKNFERTAKIIKKVKSCQTRRELSEDFSDYFASENPRFDRQRFIKASDGDC